MQINTEKKNTHRQTLRKLEKYFFHVYTIEKTVKTS